MRYHHVSYEKLAAFCIKVFEGYGFSSDHSRKITDVLLDADLCGVESHGIQRLIRYHKEITEGKVKIDAVPEIVFETPLSAVIEGNDAMGQLLGVQAMELAIEKAARSGFGMVTVRNSNHYGVARYYARITAFFTKMRSSHLCDHKGLGLSQQARTGKSGSDPDRNTACKVLKA